MGCKRSWVQIPPARLDRSDFQKTTCSKAAHAALCRFQGRRYLWRYLFCGEKRENGPVGRQGVVPENGRAHGWVTGDFPIRTAKEAAIHKLRYPSTDCWVVYILRCADTTLYTGITNNLVRRIGQHNAGTASRYTRSRRPVVLVYQEVQPDRSLALKRELAIKALPRKAKESLILAGN